MYNSIHFRGDDLSEITADYVSRHDIIYNRPVLNGYDGLPIGNGHCGGVVYHDEYSVKFPVNHTDAIDFGSDGRFNTWSWQNEEKNTSLFSCGQVSLISSMPVYNWVYLNEYRQKLNLRDATVYTHAKTPFASIQFKAYAVEFPDIIVFEVDVEQEEAAEFVIRAEKWSTPNFFHHYEQIADVQDKGLSGTESFVKDKSVFLKHRGQGTSSIMILNCSGHDHEAVRISAHRCEIRLTPAKKISFKLIIQVGVIGELENLSANSIDLSEIHSQHVKNWRDFWNKSYISISDDYLENLYYIHLYQLNSCGRGKYPPLFGGLWTWFGDSRNWGHFYHWNHQQTNWGVYSSGHPELSENYLMYRYSMLQRAHEDAALLFKSSGAYFSDISNLNGYNAIEPDTIRNFTVGAQIALDFFRHWEYTNNQEFLETRAWPFMIATAKLYLDMLELNNNDNIKSVGDVAEVYRIKGGSSAYESYLNLQESLTDYAAIISLFRSIIHAAEVINSEIADTVSDVLNEISLVLEHIYQPATEIYSHEGEDLKIFSAGRKWNDKPVKYAEGEYPYNPFPATLFSMVWPSGLIGLKDRGSDLFNTAMNTARVLFDKEIYHNGSIGCCGHSPAPQTAARLGMAEDVGNIINEYIRKYQVFPNGLMHFADIKQNQQWSSVDRPRVLPQNTMSTKWQELHNKFCGKRVEIDSEYFLHCYFEAAANISHGLQESLLQSHESAIRLLPAYWLEECIFRLHTQGGFIVSVEYSDREIRYVVIESTLGKDCSLFIPWKSTKISVRNQLVNVEYELNNGILKFHTEKSQIYEIYLTECPPEMFYLENIDCYHNNSPKHLDNSTLGLEGIYV